MLKASRPAPLDPTRIAAVRRPFDEADMFPPSVYHDPAIARSFLEPMARHLTAAGIGSLSEIFDGDAPTTPRGCIAQAWTVAEVLRAWQTLTELTANP